MSECHCPYRLFTPDVMIVILSTLGVLLAMIYTAWRWRNRKGDP